MSASVSRSSSLDSEELAIINGRQTLEEVVARLHDADSQEEKDLSSGTGLVSMNRFPFLSDLFSFGGAYGSIVVDEEDSAQEDNPIADIFLWRFPAVSIVWFSILQLIFFLHIFCHYSFLTIISVLALWQMLVDFVLVKTVPLLQTSAIVPKSFNISDVLRKHTLFSKRLVSRVAGIAHELADISIGMWKMTVFDANVARIVVVFRFVVVVLIRSFSVTTTTWLVLMGFFTIPYHYSKNKIFAAVVADTAGVNIKRKRDRFREFTRFLVQQALDRYQNESTMEGPDMRPKHGHKAGFYLWKSLHFVLERFNWIVEKAVG